MNRLVAPEELEAVPTIELLNELKRRHRVLSRGPTRAAVFGPPCIGKATQTEAFRRAFGVCRIPIAELIPAPTEGTSAPPGSTDDRAMSAFTAYLERPQCRRGFVLEGFPSTAAQADQLQQLLEKQKTPLQHAIFLDAPEETLLERCTGRLIHESSGRRYHEQSRPPVQEGLDDYTGDALVKPAHDADQFRQRQEQYTENTTLLREFFKRAGLARDVQATGTIDQVSTALTELVDSS